MRFSESDFIKIRDFIFRSTGITFDEKKIYFVKKRLLRRMHATASETPMEYLRLLKFSDPRGVELQNFINLLTTNETYFFREFNQLAVFAEHCLPEVCSRKRTLSSKRLRVWSAGCSTGEEPYTLAIILREMIEDPDDWLMEIIATDIDSNVLEIARGGLYDNRAVKDVPPSYLSAWFTRSRDGRWRVHSMIQKMCRFERVNLTDKTRMGNIVNVDFIFCRNVLIYFDDRARREVLASFHESMNGGGYIFLGHSESLGRISNSFHAMRHQGMILHQKQDGNDG